MKTLKVPFAYDINNNLYDKFTAQKNLEYYCSCGEKVKLRGGEIRQDHFYHISESACKLESNIHKAYKHVLFYLKKIKLPFKIDGLDLLIFDNIEIEKKLSDFIPDAIGYINNEKFLIEFANTSLIKFVKNEKIKKCNLFCLEMYIQNEVNSILDIENHLLNEKYNKHILHIPEYKELKILKEKYTLAYQKLQSELTFKIEQLSEANATIKDLKNKYQNLTLFYKGESEDKNENVTKIFVRDLYNNECIIAYQKGKTLKIFFKPIKYYKNYYAQL
jgi:hypothetical protein